MGCLSDVLNIVDTLSPLLTGLLGAGAVLIGSNLNNKRQERRDINRTRSKYVGALFSYINESERNTIKVRLSIEDGDSLGKARQASMASMVNLQKKYDESAVYLPDSIAQIVESILNTIATVNALTIVGEKESALKEILIAERKIRYYKKELRSVFQHMIGVKK